MALAAGKLMIGGLLEWDSERFHRFGPASGQQTGEQEKTNVLSSI
jgi:hypothetical protein